MEGRPKHRGRALPLEGETTMNKEAGTWSQALAVGAIAIGLLACALPSPAQGQGEGQHLNIGSRLELFVDDWLIQNMENTRLQLHHPQPREVVLKFDRPWEGSISFYVTVMKDGDLYRMYYRGWPDPKSPDCTAYAESKDGIHWTKPSLGIFERNGSKDNNIVWTGNGSHNFTPFKDANPVCPPEQRYKAVAGGPLWGLVSSDGLHWSKIQEQPIITEGPFDSQNLAFYDTVQQQYVAYCRGFAHGVRTIRRATSPDFIHWTKPEYVDFGDAPLEHLYTNATTPYFRAPHIYLAFPKRFVPSRKAVPEHEASGVSDGVFMTSRDGVHWDRRFLEAFLRPGLDRLRWTDRNNHIAYGVVPTSPEEISIYWVEHYRHPSCRMRRGTLRTDGFVSVNAPYAGGEFTTKAFTFEGRELVINYSTSAPGSVKVEIRDEQGKPIPGFSLDEAPEIYGDEIEHVVSWKNGSDVSALAGRPIRLRFVMKDADLYSLRFRP